VGAGIVDDMNELTRREEMSVAGAALRGAPWRAAAVTGGVVAAASYATGVVLPGPADPTWAHGLGIGLFTLIAAIGAVARPDKGDRVTRQARAWSLRHPWRFALYPAAGAAILMYPVQLIVDHEGVFGAAWDAAWSGLLVYVVAAFLTMMNRGRAASAR
jgi:hypothetical protein